MQHIESSIKVFWTKEYDRFRMINGNRQLDERKIKKIVADIENGTDVLRFCPILVKEQKGVLDIIDGQHRFYISRKLKVNVWYILAHGMTLHEIAKINSNTEKWKGKDFINCYCQLGNENYLRLRDFMDEYPLTISDALRLLHNGAVSNGFHSGKDKFEQGLFEIKCYDAAIELLSEVKKVDFKSKFTRDFLNAFNRIMKAGKINIEELVSKINSNAEDLKQHRNYKDYLLNMESIYNKGKRIREVIY